MAVYLIKNHSVPGIDCILLKPSSDGRYFGCLLFLETMSNVAVNITIQNSLQVPAFKSLAQTPRDGIARS